MSRGSFELTEKRKNEIIDACEFIYKEKGFQGVNIKEISTALDMTRPAIYHYFETKEEILLALLIREYAVWLAELADFDFEAEHSSEEVMEKLAFSLRERDVMLRILNMNLFEIEINSRVERLAEFKKSYMEETRLLKRYLAIGKPALDEVIADAFVRNLNAFLIGLYPFTHHTEKQLEAMKMVGMKEEKLSVYEAVKDFLMGLAIFQ